MASSYSQSLTVETSILDLIEEVEQRPALYQKGLKEYSDANFKKKLWDEVCEAVVVGWNRLSAEDKINKDIAKLSVHPGSRCAKKMG
ncbi:uncharacterized protein LOC129776800 isoform X2 [Toxorhynchites rutilus septentrionalis]|uniref:uncharacterized protein LOC129776800 isoform X2 n=1 Tax=Toxorhynchites rutilus septentrionalis TaxID=329112 RepID=UPI00247AD76E|nr:uncharacterized protein LOC129776800 isoform X2 [Toxorhynchites rutilus septentrionalis]